MSLTERLAINIGIKSREILNADENKEKIIVYGAINLLQVLWGIIWTTVISLIFGIFYEAMIFSIVISALRKYSGGVHASSPSRCVFIGTFVSTAVGLMIDKVFYRIDTSVLAIIGIIFILLSFIIVYKKAPVDSPKKPITNLELKQRFKISSIVLICFYLLICLVSLELYTVNRQFMYIKVFQCIALGSLWQSLTLTDKGAKVLNKVDAVLKYIFKGR